MHAGALRERVREMHRKGTSIHSAVHFIYTYIINRNTVRRTASRLDRMYIYICINVRGLSALSLCTLYI